jgi:hypothetical protein
LHVEFRIGVSAEVRADRLLVGRQNAHPVLVTGELVNDATDMNLETVRERLQQAGVVADNLGSNISKGDQVVAAYDLADQEAVALIPDVPASLSPSPALASSRSNMVPVPRQNPVQLARRESGLMP